MSYIEKPMKILYWKERMLKTTTIPIVKVLLRNHSLEESMWEVEFDIKRKHLKLFE